MDSPASVSHELDCCAWVKERDSASALLPSVEAITLLKVPSAKIELGDTPKPINKNASRERHVSPSSSDEEGVSDSYVCTFGGGPECCSVFHTLDKKSGAITDHPGGSLNARNEEIHGCNVQHQTEKVVSVEELPPSKRKWVEVWVNDTVSLIEAEPAAIKKRQLGPCQGGTAYQACKRQPLSKHDTVPLTEEALRRIDTFQDYCGSEEHLSANKTSNFTHPSDIDSEGHPTPNHTEYEDFLHIRYVLMARNLDPTNWSEILRVLKHGRESPEPSAHVHNEWKRNMLNSTLKTTANFMAYMKFTKAEWAEDGCSTVQLNQSWSKFVPLYPELTPRISAPQPDMAYGWEKSCMNHVFTEKRLTKTIAKEASAAVRSAKASKKSDIAVAETKSTSTPIKEPEYEIRSYSEPTGDSAFSWPVFTIEGKSPKGECSVAHFRNMNNGSIMVNNILALKRMIGNDDAFYGRVLVISLTLTTETMSLNCHWVSKNRESEVYFYMKVVESWSLSISAGPEPFAAAFRGIRNTVEHFRNAASKEIRNDIQTLINMETPLATPDFPTPTGKNAPRPPPEEPDGSSTGGLDSSVLGLKRLRVDTAGDTAKSTAGR